MPFQCDVNDIMRRSAPRLACTQQSPRIGECTQETISSVYILIHFITSKPTYSMMSLFGIKTLVAKKATNDLTSPLLSKYSDDTFATVAIPDKSHDEIKTKTKNIQLLTGALVAAVVTGGAISSMISFVMFPAVIVYVAGGVCLFSCPIVLYNERKIMSLTGKLNVAFIRRGIIPSQ